METIFIPATSDSHEKIDDETTAIMCPLGIETNHRQLA
jgi:hypothetical protein